MSNPESRPFSISSSPRSPRTHVIVVGAGLGGLCLAQGLRRAGISVAVYERDAAAVTRAQGHRLHIDGRGRQALSATLPPHLFELVAAVAGRPAPNANGFDHQLRPTGVFFLDDSEPGPATHADTMPAHTVIDRQVLRRILLTGLDDIVHFGRRCLGYDSDADTVTARFADGSSARGSVLVAADGVGSVIRAQRLPHARVVDSQVRLIYGRVPLTPGLRRALPPELISIFNSVVGPGNRFVGIAPVQYRQPLVAAASRLAPEVTFEPAEDTLAVMFGRRRDRLGLSDSELRAASGRRLREVVLEQISGWHPLVTRIIEKWTPSSVYPIAVRSSVPVPPWPTSNVTLLGDAIHAMSPAAGAGANIALRDAAALATALTEATSGRPLRDSLRDYEQAMIDEGFRMVRLSAANGTQTLGADPLPI
ncbi:FAD-dependent oxidoreductase [Nocardia iowensis]|uniref:FAD-dependent monooxygenase n=1 Tax=Nocardia iowensis TaxID=204891 RepID=A0ABX8RXF5_NOCIO|nr:FAD-dependent monooxygenase [Nocardia iowensis]QXN94349.1 FAD-dependent monooxygenase [Nocardia iowensis]